MDRSDENTTVWRRVVVYHLPALLWAAAIVLVSSIPDLKTPQPPDWPIDKVAHFLVYAVFALLVYRSLGDLLRSLSVNIIRTITILILSAFALLDEYHQSFVPGRHQDLADFAADVLGGLIMLIICGLKERRSSLSEG